MRCWSAPLSVGVFSKNFFCLFADDEALNRRHGNYLVTKGDRALASEKLIGIFSRKGIMSHHLMLKQFY